MKLDDLEKLCEAATPGDWHVDYLYSLRDKDGNCLVMADMAPEPGCFTSEADAKLVAASRTMLPKLIRVARSLEAIARNTQDPNMKAYVEASLAELEGEG